MILGTAVGTALALSLAATSPPVADTLQYTIRMANVTIGTGTEIRRTDADGTRRGASRTNLRVARAGQPIELTEESVWTEDPAGRLVRYRSRRTGMGPQAWSDSIARIDRGWRRVRDRGDAAIADTLPPGVIFGPIGTDAAFATPADSLRVVSLDPEDMVPRRYRAVFERADTLRAAGTRIPCRIYAVSDAAGAGPATEQWRSADGGLWREVDRPLGWTTERVGLDPDTTTGTFDAMSWRRIPLAGRPPSAPPCEMTVEANPAGGATPPAAAAAAATAPPIADGEGQTLLPGAAAGSWRVRLDRPRPAPTVEADREAWRRDPALAPSLRSGLIVDAADSSVRAFAARAVAGASTPTDEALRLEEAVHARIEIQDLRTVLGTASQTLRDRRGDCTEHAVLLAACCRARGIPARLVAGVTPDGDRMSFHLWTEAYLGRWIALDATRGSAGLDPCAVALERWNQPEEEMTELEGPIAKLAGRFRFAVLEAKP